MDWLLQWLRDPQTRPTLLGLLWTAAAAAVIWGITEAVGRALLRNVTEIADRHRIRSRLGWTRVLLFLAASLLIWASFLSDLNLGVYLGFVSAGLALSLQETLLCIAGWFLLLVRKPYDIGDRIEIDGKIGDVIDVRLFQTAMLEIGNWVQADQSTGRMLIVPNSQVFRYPIYNYTKGFPYIWNEFAVIVTFESDWTEAKRLILKQAEEEGSLIVAEVRRHIERMQGRYAIHYAHYTPIVYTSIADNGVRLSLRYLTDVRRRRDSEHRIAEGILQDLIRHPQIDFAYPTSRLYRHPDEGKVDLGGKVDPAEHPTGRAGRRG